MQYEREDADALSKVVSKYDLQFLYPLAGAEQYLPDALKQVGVSLLWRFGSMSCLPNLEFARRQHGFPCDDFASGMVGSTCRGCHCMDGAEGG